MRTFRDAKIMAKALRQSLRARQVDLSHSDCLEIVANQFGVNDWNTLSAAIGGPAFPSLRIPEGWSAAGSKPERYNAGVDPTTRSSEAVIRCKYEADDPEYVKMEKGFGTLMQSVLADRFRLKMIRFSAELMVKNVIETATLWMRVERGPGQIIRFDNMEKRADRGAVKGTSDWVAREIVVDIPEEATTIHYGFYLRGTGELRVRNLVFEEAKPEAVITAVQHRFLDGPANLAFSLS